MTHHGDFEITKKYVDETIRYTIIGYLNSVNAPVLQYELEDALKEDKETIILNMSRVDYICSIGAKIIYTASNQAKENNKHIMVERPSEIVKNVMGDTMLHNLME